MRQIFVRSRLASTTPLGRRLVTLEAGLFDFYCIAETRLLTKPPTCPFLCESADLQDGICHYVPGGSSAAMPAQEKSRSGDRPSTSRAQLPSFLRGKFYRCRPGLSDEMCGPSVRPSVSTCGPQRTSCSSVCAPPLAAVRVLPQHFAPPRPVIHREQFACACVS